jgi:hypothetical protein
MRARAPQIKIASIVGGIGRRLLKTSMALSFEKRVRIPDDVLIKTVRGESILLNLNNEMYYVLDQMGTSILTRLDQSASIQAAYESLLKDYDVGPGRLHKDLERLIGELRAGGLIQVVDQL